MIKRLLVIAAAALMLFGCAHNKNPYQKTLFIERYLDPGNPLDVQIRNTLDALRANPRSAPLHNELGQLLRRKGFPKDAEIEFERAVNADHRFYPAWYNLGLVREDRGDYPGARVAFHQTVHYKHGHAAALFQLGLMEEHRHHDDAAIEYYAKAFLINHDLLDVHVNPRILDS
ncbi:MAG TPA: tetratricopeptide repeat protein, partial [Thermoanaerobaculia bacterium]|nr:tetratricopeptide repeat protein [Thermoanaerobaculia bacterium]